MAFNISWLITDRVLLFKAPAYPVIEDIIEADKELAHYLEQLAPDAPLLHMILDDSDVEVMPGIKTFSELKSLRHPKLGWTVIVGLENKVFKMINTIISQLFRARLRMTDTV